MHKSQGIIKYDPYRGNMKKKTQWWAVANVDPNIVKYYRWWVDKEIINPFGVDGGGVSPQSWSPHISIIRGEKPSVDKMHLWKKYDGVKVEFEYDFVYNYKIGTKNNGEATGLFFVVDVFCPLLTNIRREMGLKHDWNLHMTFGRTYDSPNRNKSFVKQINNR